MTVSPVPLCLQVMTADSRATLELDFAEWGQQVRGLSINAIRRLTSLGKNRAERLHAYANHAAPETPQVTGEASPEPLPGFEPPARPAITVREADGGLSIEIQGSSGLGQEVVRNMDELYQQAAIDPREWTADDFQLRTWPTTMRLRRVDSEGNRVNDAVTVVRSWLVAAKMRRRIDNITTPADWGAPLRRSPTRSTSLQGRELCVVLPDMQIGYRWENNHRELTPLHDWAAIDCALQIAEFLQPQIIQDIGDGLDFAGFSTRFPVPIELRDTARPSILSRHGILRHLREVCPSAEIDCQGGNHEERAQRTHVGTEYDGLRRADDPTGPPVDSFASLLGLSALDITWRSYGEHRWLWDHVMVHHGDKVKNRGGLTAADYIRDMDHSSIFGHVHRLEQASRTVHGPRGQRVITASSAGCLCRVDGAVPGVTKRPNWQQGVGLVWFDQETQQDHHQLIPIVNGVAFYGGHRFAGDGQALAQRTASQTRYPQIAEGWR